MPCNSDYLEPHEFEQQCQHAAELALYVDRKLEIKSARWLIECAKNIYGAETNKQGGDDRVIPYLCERLHKLTPEQIDSIIYNARNPQSRALADWWEEHLEADRVRLQEEEKKNAKIAARKAALAKLSPAELEAVTGMSKEDHFHEPDLTGIRRTGDGGP